MSASPAGTRAVHSTRMCFIILSSSTTPHSLHSLPPPIGMQQVMQYQVVNWSQFWFQWGIDFCEIINFIFREKNIWFDILCVPVFCLILLISLKIHLIISFICEAFPIHYIVGKGKIWPGWLGTIHVILQKHYNTF